STGALTTPMVFNNIYSYRFEDASTFSSISSNPNIGNIKNDFVVWGTRSADKLPIHARCAIDVRPTSYVSAWEKTYRIGDLIEPPMRAHVKSYGYKNNGEYTTSNYSGTYVDSTGEKKSTLTYYFSALTKIPLNISSSHTAGITASEIKDII
ncbi:MAG: hypothetical protein J6Q15_01100, partial [Clostridia bacterium]|nr:hypothetical protein [Clostridia bacterium]